MSESNSLSRKGFARILPLASGRHGLQSWTVAVCVGVCLAVVGCNHPYPRKIDKEMISRAAQWTHEGQVSCREYRTAPPDVITILVRGVPELTGHQRIRPDGRIAMGVFGEVKVSGLTPLEISDKLEKFLDRYYRDVEVAVNVSGFYSKEIYVFGQVNSSYNQGVLRYTGQETALEVIARSGGISNIAAARYVKLIRPNVFKGNQPEQYRVNLYDIVLGGDYQTNILVQPNDAIYVPPTPTGAAAIFLRRMLLPSEPILRAAHNARVYDDIVDGDFFDDKD